MFDWIFPVRKKRAAAKKKTPKKANQNTELSQLKKHRNLLVQELAQIELMIYQIEKGGAK